MYLNFLFVFGCDLFFFFFYFCLAYGSDLDLWLVKWLDKVSCAFFPPVIQVIRQLSSQTLQFRILALSATPGGDTKVRRKSFFVSLNKCALKINSPFN